MNKIPDIREIFPPPQEIVSAGLSGDLVFFVGAGASMLLGYPSWDSLAKKALVELQDRNCLNYSEIEQLRALDPKKQLSIAYQISDEYEFRLDLAKYLTGKIEGDSIYKAINDIGCPCVTTNYDDLIAPRFNENKDGSTTPSQARRISEREELYANLLNEPGTVVHLHGLASKPDTMIVSTKDYLEHYDNEKVQVFLGELFEKKTILFIGYGLEESEILEHILRRGSARRSPERKRFALQGFFLSQKPLYDNLYKYYEKSFGVHLLGFMRDHQDYNCLEQIIKSWVNQIEIRKPPLIKDKEFMDEVLGFD